MARFGMIGNQYEDDAGNPLVAGQLFFFESGTNIPKDTFADVDHEIENSNPVILTGAGRQPNVFFDGTAKVILTDSNLVQIEERDPEGATTSSIFGPWNAFATYDNTRTSIAEASDGNLYQSLQNANKDNDPTTSPAFWEQIEFNRFYNENVTYSINDITVEDGTEYRSRVNDNLANTPSTSPTEWANTSGIGPQTIYVPSTAMTGRLSNGAAPASVQTSPNLLMIQSFDFDATVDEFIQFTVQMPASWDSGPVRALFDWSHAATTTNFGVNWNFQGRAVNNDGAIDGAFGVAMGVTDIGGTTDNLYITSVTPSVTISNEPAPFSLVTFQIFRDVSDAGDNMDIDARLQGVTVLYTAVSSVDNT